MTGVAVVGCGYWGPNLVRNFAALDGVEVRAICDRDPVLLANLKRRYPAVRTYSDADALREADDVDAVAISTPVAAHHPLGMACLRAGKHVMLEKPMADTVEKAAELVELAQRQGRVLHVDHTFIHSGAVRKMREMVDSGAVGDLLYIDSVRINLGLFQSDVNVVWDLAPHDISIISYLIGEQPKWVSAVGSVHYGRHESQAYVTLRYGGSLVAHLHVNWLAPVKLRSTLIGGSKRMIVYDDLAPSEKIKVYEKGVTAIDEPGARERTLVDYRVGDMLAPYIEKTEPLERACRGFIDSIQTGAASPADGQAGLDVVRILEAAQRSIERDGERIALASLA